MDRHGSARVDALVIGVAIVIGITACEKKVSSPAPTHDVGVKQAEPKEAAPKSEDASAPPKTEVELPEFVDAPEEQLEAGVRRLSNCVDFAQYAREVFADSHLRRIFGERYGTAIPMPPRTKVFQHFRLLRWTVDAPWLYLQEAEDIHGVDASSSTTVSVKIDGHSPPAFASSAHGFLVLAKSYGREVVEYVQFSAETQTPSSSTTHVHWKKTALQLWEREDDQLEHRRSLSMNGELEATHVGSDALYIITSTEMHVRRGIEDRARKIGAGGEPEVGVDEIRDRLTSMFNPTAQTRPGYGVKRGRSGSKAYKGDYVACDDVWVPRDSRARGDELLTIYRLDLDTLELDWSIAIGSDHSVADIAGDRLYVLRRLRGRIKGEAVERPVSQLEIFDLGEEPELVSTALVDGLPLDLRAVRGHASLVTTRWMTAETLVYALIDTEVSDEPKVLPADTRLGNVVGEPEVWSSGLLSTYDVVGELGSQRVVGMRSDEGTLRFDLLGPDGEKIATAATPDDVRVAKLEPNSFVTSESAFALRVGAFDDQGRELDLVLGSADEGEMKVSAVSALTEHRVRGGAIVGEDYVALTPSGVLWVPLESGAVVREKEWER